MDVTVVIVIFTTGFAQETVILLITNFVLRLFSCLPRIKYVVHVNYAEHYYGHDNCLIVYYAVLVTSLIIFAMRRNYAQAIKLIIVMHQFTHHCSYTELCTNDPTFFVDDLNK